MRVSVAYLDRTPEIIQLVLGESPELLAEQQRVLARHPSHRPVEQLHVTLGSAPQGWSSFSSPPLVVEFEDQALMVTRPDKTSTFLRVTRASQALLAEYVARLELVAGASIAMQDHSRIFHASLTNLEGTSRASIAKVWQHYSSPV